MPKLRYLPTSEELRLSTLTPAQRQQKEWDERCRDRVIAETVRILLRRGHNPSTCEMCHCYEALADAKRRLGPAPLFS